MIHHFFLHDTSLNIQKICDYGIIDFIDINTNRGKNMAKKQLSKSDYAVSNLLGREDYLIVKHNDLAKAFGRLNRKELQLLDFTLSFVTEDSQPLEVYETSLKDITKIYGLNTSGANYKYTADMLKSLSNKDTLYLYGCDEVNGESITMVSLFDFIKIYKDSAKVEFSFSRHILPYILGLKRNYYSFKLRELSQIRSKYSLILLQLWQANDHGKYSTTIKGSVEEWQDWFIGKEKRWATGRFTDKVLHTAMDEIIDKLHCDINLERIMDGRKILAWEMTIIRKGATPSWKKISNQDVGEQTALDLDI